MKNHRSTRLSEPITGIAEATAERVRLGGELLQQLALAVAANENTQRRFRNAVLIRLSRIETILQMTHAAQIVEAHRSEPCPVDKMREHATDAEDYIAKHSTELGLKMVSYIYDEPKQGDVQSKTRRKRSL